jgi:hypothetical protein
MTPSTPAQDLAAQWKSACRLYPIYFELAREFAIDVKPCPDLEAGVDTPGKETVEQANRWLEDMDEHVQVHQMRQFLQTSSLVNQQGVLSLAQHFLAKTAKTDTVRDKLDFLLVQYFSQLAPSGVGDAEVDLAYVAQYLEPLLGEVELKPPVWLNSLDRVLEGARRCRSLDELLHGGVLEQGRKAKGQSGELFYLPIALVAFTRFGYLMRRSFFRLMLGDLNTILEGLSELEDKGVVNIDCRRAQFSAQEPIVRLRMICQSWKVMFQAEYSSGQPLRMLVDLRASVDQALGGGKVAEAGNQADTKKKPAATEKRAVRADSARKVGPATKNPVASAATAGASASGALGNATAVSGSAAEARVAPGTPNSDAAEFEVSSTPGWDSDSEAKTEKS